MSALPPDEPQRCEDVHWIDKASQEVLTAVVEAMVSVPVLLVLVYRPEYLHAWADRAYHAQIALTRLPGASSAAMVRAILTKPYAARVPLERLTAEQSQAMVQDLLGTATLPPELERLIIAKTDGNPLFVEELTISLLESGDLVQEPAGYRLTRPLAALNIPATVQGVLLACDGTQPAPAHRPVGEPANSDVTALQVPRVLRPVDPPSERNHTLVPLVTGMQEGNPIKRIGKQAETVVKAPGLSSACTME